MEKYVTVVSVDDHLQTPTTLATTTPPQTQTVSTNGGAAVTGPETVRGPVVPPNGNLEGKRNQEARMDRPEDSQFVTVLSINPGADGVRDSDGGTEEPNAPEVVLVYRLPGERLGFGLKFQGGTRSNEKIQRLFIQSCAENSPASRVLASWGHLREGDEILEIDGVSVTRMTRIECVKCLKDSNVAIKLLVRNGEGKVQNFFPDTGRTSPRLENVGELPERKSAPPPPPPVPPRKLNKRNKVATNSNGSTTEQPATTSNGHGQKEEMAGSPMMASQKHATPGLELATGGPPDAESYSNLFADDISDLISESDDTASTISTVVDKFSICSSLSSEDYTIPSNGAGPMGIGASLELAKALKPFTLLEQEFNLESKFEPTNLFTFKPPPPVVAASTVQVTSSVATKTSTLAPGSNVLQLEVAGDGGEYENVTIKKVDENRNYENVAVPYGPYENVTIQTVQPYENMVLSRAANRRRLSVTEKDAEPEEPSSGGVYEQMDLKAQVPPRPLPRQGSTGAIVEPKKRTPIPVPIPIVVPPPRLKPVTTTMEGVMPSVAPLGPEYNTIQSWLQEATEVIHECTLVPTDAPTSVEDKIKPSAAPSVDAAADLLPRLIDFHPKVSVPLKTLDDGMDIVAPPTSPKVTRRFDGVSLADQTTPEPEMIVRKCIKIISSEDHTYIESSSSDEDDDKLYGRRSRTSEDEDDRSSVLSREATTPEQFLSGDGFSDEDGEKLGPPEIVSGGPSEAYFNFPWTSNLLPPIGEVEEEFSSLEHQHNGPIVIIDTADETVINDTNNNQQRERKKPIGDEALNPVSRVHSNGSATAKIVIGAAPVGTPAANVTVMTLMTDAVLGKEQQPSAVADRDTVHNASSTEATENEPSQEQPEEQVAIPVTSGDEYANSGVQAQADKADKEIRVTDGAPGLSTCQPAVSSDHNADTAGSGTVMAQHPVDQVELREELEQSNPTTKTNEPLRDEDEQTGRVPEGPPSEVPDKPNEPKEAPVEVATRKHSVEELEECSQIEAICGDVDIVVGDTVESDFEELVKAQIEPLDVADSTEQIQQIHERIIVGIERAVSDDGDDDDAAADAVVVGGGDGGDSDVQRDASDSVAVASAIVDGSETVDDGAVDSAVQEQTDGPSNSTTVEQEVSAEVTSSPTSVAVAEQNSEAPQDAASEDPSEQELGHIAALVTGGTAAAGVRDTRNERSVTVITSHSPDGGSDDNSNRNNSSDDDDHGIADECEGNGHGGVPVASSAKSMDSMNNVVTTTTTVTAIASTVHQLIPAAPATAPPPPTTTAAAASIGGKVAAPPAFSRLPPDGHEFPPNFSEPSATSTTPTGNGQAAVAAMTIMNPGSLPAPVLAKSNDKHSSFNDDLPDLPKSHPPPIPRKVLRQDLHTPPKTTNGSEPATNGDGVRKPPPFPARSSSIAESMLSRKELPPAYQTQQSSYEPPAAYRRRSVDVPEHPPTKPPTGTTGRVTLLGSNWRKDEKSERSVRDKIAMFSSESSGHAVPAPSTMTRKFGSKDFTKSSENLLSRDGGGQTTKRSTVDPIETYATLRKKAHSVENLDEVDKALPAPRLLASDSTPKFSLETSKPVVLGKAYSVENLNPQIRPTDITKSGGSGGVSLAADANKVLARTISFSGSYSNGSSLASVNQNSPAGAGDERWKSSISNLLEQRKKSMSKLRGLIIPEKVPEAEVLADSRIIGLPIIKSKDSEIILSGGLPKVEPVLPAAANSPALSYSRRTSTLPTPAKSSLNALAQTKTVETILTPTPYKPRSHSLVSPSESKQSGSESESGSGFFRKPLPPMPPAKPPRTSLVYPPPKGGSIDSGLRSTEDESGDDDEDSDSVLSSRISSPPVSPAAPVEKYTLTRTLSSETNTSITSSNSSTLTTSSAGSQASCSSVGSTPPTVDLSRKLSKSSTSSEATMNRKNVLASAKCRSGRGGELIKIGSGADGEPGLKATKGRYEDGDSTDGYEEEERRKVSKSKPRNSSTVNTGAAETTDLKRKELTHYKLVDGSNAGGDSIVDKVIKVAAYVEVVSDLEDASSELIEEEIVTSIKESPVTVLATPTPEQKKTRSASVVSGGGGDTMSDLAKWVRHEAARTISSHKDTEPKHLNAGVGRLVERKVVPRPEPVSAPVPVPVKRELRSSVETKKLNLAEIRKSFESKSANSTVIPAPVKMAAVVMKETTVNAVVPSTPTSIATVAQSSPKNHATTGPANGHDRFSSWDSLASSSSGVSSLQTNSLGLGATAPNCSGSSQTLQSTPSDYGSFSSLGSSHSLITPQDLQLIIEEADPPLATPDAFVVVLQRETPESSIGITLAGGSDYEAKEITIHKILTNSPAEKDGRLRKGDRILSINGLSMRGLTHRESLSVLKTPRPEVVMVITRSKSLVVTDTLAKLKRPSMGSLSSLAEKSELGSDYERKIKAQHKASRSLDLDHLDVASNEAESVFDGTASEDGLLSADDVSKCSSSTNATDNVVPVVADIVDGCRIVDVSKDGAGLGFSIEGGYDSPAGNKPLVIKKIFMGGAAEKSGLLRAGEEIVAINEVSIAKMTRIQVWNMMKKLPNGTVRLTLK